MNNEYYLDTYFEKCGLDVTFNTLGRTEELARAYVSETQQIVDSTPSKRSHHVKTSCYAKFYNMEDRIKHTGFEKFDELAIAFKTKRSMDMTNMQFSPSLRVTRVQSSPIGYTRALKNNLKTFVKPIMLYLSGGMDSELVAMALLDADIKFTPVIFSWTDNAGEVQNSFDTDYAFKFCRTHSLLPVVRTVNIEQLWASDEFTQLSYDSKLISAHVTTHIYMAKLMNADYPNVSHLFGGEVRYSSDYDHCEDSPLENLVSLSKITPGYNGSLYRLAGSQTGGQGILLGMDSVLGTWSVFPINTGIGGWIPAGPTSGSYTNTLTNPYQFQTSINTGFVYTGSPPPSTYVYSTYSNGSDPIQIILGSYQGVAGQRAYGSFTINIKTITGGQTGVVATSVISLDLQAG